MTDTPSTAAGRALLDNPAMDIALAILAIEAEARAEGAAEGRAQMFGLLEVAQQARDANAATIVALREALLKLGGQCVVAGPDFMEVLAHANRVLIDTAPAAASAKAEIEQTAVEPWRAALERLLRDHECEPESESLRLASIAADEAARALLNTPATPEGGE
jgi:hypothetical protein